MILSHRIRVRDEDVRGHASPGTGGTGPGEAGCAGA